MDPVGIDYQYEYHPDLCPSAVAFLKIVDSELCLAMLLKSYPKF